MADRSGICMQAPPSSLDLHVLDIDAGAVVEQVCRRLRDILARKLSRRGFVIAISGGVDSAVCAALAAAAVGPERVLGLLLPERDSVEASAARGQQVAEYLRLRYELTDIAPALDALGCYRLRDEAFRTVVPEYGAGWRSKIVIRGGEGRLNHFHLVVETPSGEIREERLGLREYLQIVAATNYKQRLRKAVEYYHADRLNYAVIGTPNRLEYDQGFFVKNGDGSADVKPIAHLYKTQVYALARHLGLPPEVCAARPTTDTYSLAQGQDEFFFRLPYEQMDLALWAHDHGHSSDELAEALSIDARQAADIYADIESKRRSTRYLHRQPLLIEPVSQVGD